MSSDFDFDVAIIGGGPGGASLGAYLARAGVKVGLFERELFPRPHVGESLVPSSTRVFSELGFLPEMERRGFPRKYGAVWTSSEKARPYAMDWAGFDPVAEPDGAAVEPAVPSGEVAVRFSERGQPGISQDYTYHVDRAQFDLALLQHAHRLGCDVIEGVGVRQVELGPKDARLSVALGRREIQVRSRLVVDASGRRTLLGSQLGLKVKDPVFDQVALHRWFKGFERGPEPHASFIQIHFLPIDNTWVWQIPISEDTTSIGVVCQKASFRAQKLDREAYFWKCIGSRTELESKLRAAEPVTELKMEGDYSYAMTQITGDRYLLIGDAARFVDPIFSTGVSIALNSARFAHRDILVALETGRFDRASFSPYEQTMQRGIRNWYEFIAVYYRLNVLFSYFVAHPRHRLDVLKLLQGDVYDEDEPAVLRLMKDKVREVEDNPSHMWHRVLSNLTADAFRSLARPG